MMAPIRDRIIMAAEGWLGVRWQHQGRSRAGIDCIGLIECVAAEVGLNPVCALDVSPGYGRVPDGRALKAGLDAHLVRLADPGHAQPGDVLLMRFEAAPQHVALLAHGPFGPEIIHAWAGARRVVRHGLDATWSSRIVLAYRFEGVQ